MAHGPEGWMCLIHGKYLLTDGTWTREVDVPDTWTSKADVPCMDRGVYLGQRWSKQGRKAT